MRLSLRGKQCKSLHSGRFLSWIVGGSAGVVCNRLVGTRGSQRVLRKVVKLRETPIICYLPTQSVYGREAVGITKGSGGQGNDLGMVTTVAEGQSAAKLLRLHQLEPSARGGPFCSVGVDVCYGEGSEARRQPVCLFRGRLKIWSIHELYISFRDGDWTPLALFEVGSCFSPKYSPESQ